MSYEVPQSFADTVTTKAYDRRASGDCGTSGVSLMRVESLL